MKYSDVKIGMRVQYQGGLVVSKCTGFVEKLYPPIPGDPDDPGAIRMRVDSSPDLWPYEGCVFAPWVDKIEPA